MKQSIQYSSIIVIMDSGFYIIRGLIELSKRGLFIFAVIKKQRYWLKYIDGNKLKEHFNNTAVEAVTSLLG